MRLTLISFLLVFARLFAQPAIQISSFKTKLEYKTLNNQDVLVNRSSEFVQDSSFILVPENRSSHSTRSIKIPIRRIRSTQASKSAPIFWLSGGPGQTNLKSFRYDYFVSSHDHVMVGYRGVDGDVSLNCPEVVKVLEECDDVLTPETVQKVAAAYGAGARRLKLSGVDVGAYTLLAVVDDLEEARKALGYDLINIVSESYGTRVAYLYALKYPDHIQRMVMIGVNPPGRMVWDPWQYDSLLMRYGDLWKRDSEATAYFPDLVEAFRKVRQDFPKRWLVFPIREGTVKASVNVFLFHRETAAQVFDAYCAAAKGDASGLWLISLVGSRIFPDVVNWGDNASKAMSADFDSTRDYYHELNPPDAIFGAPMGAFLWGPAQMRTWPVSLIPTEYRRARRCNVQTLFLNGTVDFSTPAENTTKDLLPYFPNGHHVVLAEAGHVLDLWESQPAATRQLLTKFLDEGTIDTSLVRYVPMSFHVSWGFPKLAKLVVGGAVVLSGILIGFVWLVVKRIARRGSKSLVNADEKPN